jgi:outer membrane lipase/esterase
MLRNCAHVCAYVVVASRRLAFLGSAALLLAHSPVGMGQAAPAPPTVSGITFSPAAIASGGTSQLRIAFGNANAVAATLTQTLTDTLPAGMTVANGGAGGSCTTGAVGAAAGSGTITYAVQATIPAGGCSITVSVTARSAAPKTDYTNTIAAGALQTDLGTNPGAASATLTVQAAVVAPNVVGMSQATAANALQAAGLVVGAVTHAPGPSGIPFNAVFSQNPGAGASIAAGSTVAINISTGPGNATNLNSPLTSVPNFVDPEQLSIAAALERVCAQLQTPGPTLTVSQQNLLANCTAIIGTHGGGVDASGLHDTLNAISGKQSTAQQRTGVQFSGTQFANIGARLAQLRQGAGGASFAGLDLGVPTGNGLGEFLSMLQDMTGFKGLSAINVGGSGGEESPDAVTLSRWGFFINGTLRGGSQDTTINETGFDFRSNGITAGADYRLRENLVLGLALGHSNGNTHFTDGTGRLDSRGNSVSLYATYYRDELYVDAIGTLGHVSYDAARTTSFSIDENSTSTPTNCVSGQCSIDVTGSTGARQLAFATNVGYGFHYRGLAFGPDAALNYTRVDVNGFAESDPSQTGMALAFSDQTGESLLLKAGGHLSYALNTRFAVILPEARAHYVHEFKNDQRAATVHFVDDPNVGTPNGPVSNFVIFTDRPSRGYFDWAAGFSAQFPYGISAFADYSALAGEGSIRTHEVAFGIRIQRLAN